MLRDDFTDVPLADGGDMAMASWRQGWTPRPVMTVSEWADKHRKLPREAAAEPGQWRTSRTPYLRAIMDDLSVHSPVTEVTIRKSTQVGGTEVGINFASYVVDHAPGPMMYVLPSLPVARNFSEQRLQPMIDLMPVLSSRIGPKRSRDASNTVLLKKFPAGFLVLSGANSASSLASMPIKYLVLDELSKYPRDLDDQGSAQVQAVRRTSSFTTRKKIARISSPTVKDACDITEEFERGTQSHYHVPCPHCQTLQPLQIDQLTDEGEYLCEHCGMLIAEQHKDWMLKEKGHSEDGQAEWVARYPGRLVHSYQLWAAYAPIGLGYTWKEIADMRREAKDDPEKEVTFANTILGEPFEGASEKIESKEVSERAEKWMRRQIPRDCLIVTVGIDVQVDRFSIGVWGWGRNDNVWAIDWVELPGDPTQKDDWHVVDDYLAQPLSNSAGQPVRISGYAVDSGNWTHDVYNFVRPRQAQGFIAIKGANIADAPVISRPTKIDTRRNGKVDTRGVKRWMVGGNAIKTSLMRRLHKDAELPDERRRFHFPADHPEEFYQQLTAERFDLTLRRWIMPKGKRNEVLDTLQYAYAVACSPMVRLPVLRDVDWTRLEDQLQPPTNDLFAAGDTDATAIAVPVPPAEKTGPEKPTTTPSTTARPRQETRHNPFASDEWSRR